jgi:uncharacterized membrane protein
MLLSHHVPSDYDRTWQVGSVRVCVRCLGVVLGATVVLGLWKKGSDIPLLLAIATAVPGVLDFTLHELGLSASSSARRCLTGLLFGVFVAALLRAVIDTKTVHILLFLSWFLLLQVISAIALKRSGRVESLIRKYEGGVHVAP